MKVTVLAVGRLREDYLKAAEAEYVKRLGRFCRFEVKELKDDAALERALPEGALVAALDERGELLSSAGFARELLGRAQTQGAELVFVIGGAEGMPAAMRKRADRVVAFGKMTVAHRLVRVLLAEQIYRGFTILTGHPYHK